ncbi:MAG: hypothetical protein PHX83_04220 [Acidobacteriia bacterium]|nr:hypothetical protein [Terriglobia bacterium]
MILKILKRLVIAAALAAAVIYLGDYAALRWRIFRHQNPYGSVTLQRYYAVTQKNKTTEFYFDPPTAQVCVHSFFPHNGFSPCWYLNRHQTQRINM